MYRDIERTCSLLASVFCHWRTGELRSHLHTVHNCKASVCEPTETTILKRLTLPETRETCWPRHPPVIFTSTFTGGQPQPPRASRMKMKERSWQLMASPIGPKGTTGSQKMGVPPLSSCGVWNLWIALSGSHQLKLVFLWATSLIPQLLHGTAQRSEVPHM
jgi:hypothetical protein